MCAVLYEEKIIIFDKITAFLEFEILQLLAIESLYNQLLLQCYSNQSEILHKCFRHIEDVHLLFFEVKKKIIFDKITAILDFEILQFLANTLKKVSIINSSYSF